MRPFHAILCMLCLSAAVLTGCGGDDDDNCGSTSGCMPPPETCGDDACQAGEGENAQNCPEDCVPSTCGDGTCSAADHETAENCSADCNVTCLGADKPVYCADTNSCWPAGTDCSLPTYVCGDDHTSRCTDEGDAINCCDGLVYTCWETQPYYCPENGWCVADTSECPEASTACTVWGLSCAPE